MAHMSLGISSLDEQHEALAGMLKAFQSAILGGRPHDEIAAMAETAQAAFRAHFQHEEALALRSAADMGEHRQAHERLLAAIAVLSGDVLEGHHSPQVLGEQADRVRELFEAHIGREDLALSRHLMSLGMA